jgi:alpha-beta hydrolase superfamily lysophospholipase
MGALKLTSADGLSLHVYEWLPEGETMGVVQIAHGMAEHGARYQRLAEFLNGAGYAVYANDHRGHGLTIPEGRVPGHMADKGGWRLAVDDLSLINEEIKRRHANKKVILMGHSMGSFMVQDYLARYGDTIAGAALSATNGPPGGLGKLAQLVSRIKAFAPNRTEFDWLSRDELEVDMYVEDPLCGFDCSIATWIGLLDALTRIGSDQAMSQMDKEMPIYVFSGTEDPVGEKTKGVERLLKAYQKNGFKNVEHRFYNGGRHEILNETNRDEVMKDLLTWIEKTVQS